VPSLTLAEARARAAQLSDVSYAVEIDLTDQRTFGSRVTVHFASSGPDTFLELHRGQDVRVTEATLGPVLSRRVPAAEAWTSLVAEDVSNRRFTEVTKGLWPAEQAELTPTCPATSRPGLGGRGVGRRSRRWSEPASRRSISTRPSSTCSRRRSPGDVVQRPPDRAAALLAGRAG